MALKGQIMGPLSWALEVVDEAGTPLLYNEILLDATAKHLRLKAAWQEAVLRRRLPMTLIVIEEPLLTKEGLASLPFEREQSLALLEDVLGGISGLKGIHCGWPIDRVALRSISANVLSVDISNVLGGPDPDDASLAGLGEFVARGGLVIWSIVPTNERVEEETTESLTGRFQLWLDRLAAVGAAPDEVVAMSMISASSGLGTASTTIAERVLSLTMELSNALRARYGLTE
jgi:hypothetical protein